MGRIESFKSRVKIIIPLTPKHYDYEKKPEYLEIIYECTGRKKTNKKKFEYKARICSCCKKLLITAPLFSPQMIYLNIIKSILLHRLKWFYMFSVLILDIKQHSPVYFPLPMGKKVFSELKPSQYSTKLLILLWSFFLKIIWRQWTGSCP